MLSKIVTSLLEGLLVVFFLFLSKTQLSLKKIARKIRTLFPSIFQMCLVHFNRQHMNISF